MNQRPWTAMRSLLALVVTIVAVMQMLPSLLATGAHTSATLIEKMTGPGSINDTWGRWDIKGTDLGIMWDNGAGQVLTAFGDTFGDAWTGPGVTIGPGDAAWRSNVLLRSNDATLSDGMRFQSAPEQFAGRAAELIPSLKVDNVEITVIPTAGVSVGTRQYLGYMSVRHWGPAGQWDTNRAGIAWSDDNGEHWTTAGGPVWENPAGDHDFQMQAFVRRNGFVYVYGTPNGRFGAAHVARVPEAQMLNKSQYQYWNGSNWIVNNDTVAAAIVPGPVGELSVHYHAFAGRYVMMYLGGEDIVMRTAINPEGPWSSPQVVVSSADYPGLYGGFIHPWSVNGTLYFTLSQWNPYNVFLMAVTIDTAGLLTKPNQVGDPSFERGAMNNGLNGTWACSPNCGIDNTPAGGYSGDRNGFTRYNTGWRNVWQQMAVQPNTNYRMTGWVRTSANSDNAYMGARTTSGVVINEVNFPRTNGWQRFTITFNSGSNSAVQIFAGVWTNNGDIWIQLDDFSVVRQ